MTDQDKRDLLAEYRRRKATGQLPSNLYPPVPSGIRDECLKLYKTGIRPEGTAVLEGFLKKNHKGNFAAGVLDMDLDKFRPTRDLLKGKIFEPDEKHYQLLDWLLGPERTAATEGDAGTDADNENVIRRLVYWLKKKQKKLIIGGIAICILATCWWLFISLNRQCMYWNGDEYKAVYCGIPRTGNPIYAIDQRKMLYFRKVMRPDTVTQASVGKLWYFKANRQLELYTDSGMHPVLTNRRLLPLSLYMQRKYLTKKEDTR